MIDNESVLRVKNFIMDCLEKMSYVQIHAVGIYLASIIGAEEMTHGVVNAGKENEMVIYRRSDIVHAVYKIVNSDESDFNKHLDLMSVQTILVGMDLFGKAYRNRKEINSYYSY